jgi:hypothetical protein
MRKLALSRRVCGNTFITRYLENFYLNANEDSCRLFGHLLSRQGCGRAVINVGAKV